MCPYAVPQSVSCPRWQTHLPPSIGFFPQPHVKMPLHSTARKTFAKVSKSSSISKPTGQFQPYAHPVPSSMTAPSSCLFWKHVIHSTSCYWSLLVFFLLYKTKLSLVLWHPSLLQPFHSLHTINQDFDFQSWCPNLYIELLPWYCCLISNRPLDLVSSLLSVGQDRKPQCLFFHITLHNYLHRNTFKFFRGLALMMV